MNKSNFNCLTQNYQGRLIDQSTRGNGKHRTYLIELNGRPVVVKCFGRRKSVFNVCVQSIANFFAGLSPIYVNSRYKNERATIALWQKHGFSTLPIINDVPPCAVGKPWLFSELADALPLKTFLVDAAIPLAEKAALMTAFWQITAKRHKLALATNQRRLIHIYPIFDHFLITHDKRILTLDFEVSFVRFVPVKRLIGRELTMMLKALEGAFMHDKASFDYFFDLMQKHYSYPKFLCFMQSFANTKFIDNRPFTKAAIKNLLAKLKSEGVCA